MTYGDLPLSSVSAPAHVEDGRKARRPTPHPACRAFLRGCPQEVPAWPTILPMGQLYQLKIVAEGEVRDADGNLLEQRPVEATAVLTEEQARQLSAQHGTNQEQA